MLDAKFVTHGTQNTEHGTQNTEDSFENYQMRIHTVSYTHLTLPTICSV